jgi:hypothetical protein
VYEFIAAEKTTYPVRLLCRLLGVGHSAFYQWLRTGRQRTAERQGHDQARAEVARRAWAEHRSVYGARRLTTELHERGHRWNRKTVARLMRLAGIEGAHRRHRGKPRRTAASTATAPDLVQRRFAATAPNRLWVADISYLRTWEGFLYLAVVVDAFSRRVVGWAMADHLRTELILDAVGMAIQHRKPIRDQLIHHSDRGSQGGFNWSSQRLVIVEVFGGATSAAGGSGVAAGDAFARQADAGTACGARVLAADRPRQAHRGSRGRARCVDARCGALVSSRWRHAAVEPGRALRPLPFIRRARGDRSAQGAGARCPRDRPTARAGPGHDLA